MSSLLLLRHGQASFGMADYDQLSPVGLRQAEATGAFLQQQGLSFDRALVGPRRRQLGTAQVVARRLGHPAELQLEPALDEFAEGSQVLTGSVPEPPAQRKDQLRAYAAVLGAWSRGEIEIAGAPSAAVFCARVAVWLDRLADEPRSSQRILAVTSAGVIGAAVCAALGLGPHKLMTLMGVLRNASLSEIVYTRGRLSLLSFNGVTHLAPELVTLM